MVYKIYFSHALLNGLNFISIVLVTMVYMVIFRKFMINWRKEAVAT